VSAGSGGPLAPLADQFNHQLPPAGTADRGDARPADRGGPGCAGPAG